MRYMHSNYMHAFVSESYQSALLSNARMRELIQFRSNLDMNGATQLPNSPYQNSKALELGFGVVGFLYIYIYHISFTSCLSLAQVRMFCRLLNSSSCSGFNKPVECFIVNFK